MALPTDTDTPDRAHRPARARHRDHRGPGRHGRHPGHRSPAEGIGPEGPELLPLDAGEQYRFGFDMGACIGCHSCEVACAEQNGLPASTTWRRVGEIEGTPVSVGTLGGVTLGGGTFDAGPSGAGVSGTGAGGNGGAGGGAAQGAPPAARRFHLSMSCNHCLDPACLEGCPTLAYEKLDNGVVAHHADDCIGCQYCTWNCPYSVPAFQPDRRIVTKCDMCQPRLAEGLAPACVGACPTHAITVEKVNVEQWRADHGAGDAPGLPEAGITLSTTRIALPEGIPADTFGASDWNVRPEHPHWSLVWLTLLSQLAVGVSVTAGSTGERVAAALLAGAALVGATFHLGRPAAAWKAFRNLRRSWLSREVLLLSLYAALALATVAVPVLALPAAAVGVTGVYASARIYMVPGRPAWDSRLTVVRFLATAAALGPLLTGRPGPAVAGTVVAVAGTAANWWRLRRDGRREARGSLQLELGRFRPWTAARLATAAAGAALALAGAPVAAFSLVATGELVGRWLFYVTVVPLNMPGAFWRGAAGSHR